MGCCATHIQLGDDDAVDGGHITHQERRLWAELEELSLSSSADTAEEPSKCSMSIKQYVITVHAKFVFGITGTMDTTPDGVVYEVVDEPALRPKQIKRIIEWLERTKHPTITGNPAPLMSPTRESVCSDDMSNNAEPPRPTEEEEGYGEPPRMGDLQSSSDGRRTSHE